MSILDELAAHARARVAADKAKIPPEEMRELARQGQGAGAAVVSALKREASASCAR
jgi:hypothetical protein